MARITLTYSLDHAKARSKRDVRRIIENVLGDVIGDRAFTVLRQTEVVAEAREAIASRAVSFESYPLLKAIHDGRADAGKSAGGVQGVARAVANRALVTRAALAKAERILTEAEARIDDASDIAQLRAIVEAIDKKATRVR